MWEYRRDTEPVVRRGRKCWRKRHADSHQTKRALQVESSTLHLAAQKAAEQPAAWCCMWKEAPAQTEELVHGKISWCACHGAWCMNHQWHQPL